jgi:hypothetical protein
MRDFCGEIKVPVHICQIKCEDCGKVVRLVESKVTACKCGKTYCAFVEVVTYETDKD